MIIKVMFRFYLMYIFSSLFLCASGSEGYIKSFYEINEKYRIDLSQYLIGKSYVVSVKRLNPSPVDESSDVDWEDVVYSPNTKKNYVFDGVKHVMNKKDSSRFLTMMSAAIKSDPMVVGHRLNPTHMVQVSDKSGKVLYYWFVNSAMSEFVFVYPYNNYNQLHRLPKSLSKWIVDHVGYSKSQIEMSELLRIDKK